MCSTAFTRGGALPSAEVWAMNLSKLALFLSGLFFGGAIDHAILGGMGRAVTPYGLESGVAGNWLLAALDFGLAAGLYALHRSRDESFRNRWKGTSR